MNALEHGNFLVLEAGNLPLQLGLVRLLIVGNALEGMQLLVDLLSFTGELLGLLLGIFKLSCDVVDMSLEGQDLLDIVFLLLLMLCDGI